MRYKTIYLTALLSLATGTVTAQINYSTWGSSHPSPETDCGIYQWPEVQAPCPEVQIKQKHDHTPLRAHLRMGWDTVVDCSHDQLVLSCMPYIPVQNFNGYYAVDTIPYNPTDTTFYLNYVPNGSNPGRWKVPVNNDDDYNNTYTDLGFNFFFFGNQRNSFCVGDNGIVTFMPQTLTGISASSNYCPFNIPQGAVLPWNATNGRTPDGDRSFNRMHEAIYGVYEDTFTGANGSYMSGNQGIYYGVKKIITANYDTCQMGIATWNEIPIYNNSQVRESFQMVCYEGSNMIEVHVKHRYGGTNTSYGQGFIGIQNADGNPQQKGPIGSTTYYVLNGAPAAFWPDTLQGGDRNCFTDQVHYKSYRFTPQGGTFKQYEWYRLFDNGDTVQLRNITADPDAANDPNGYYYPMGSTSTCPTLTRAVVRPDTTARYVFHLRFKDANNIWHKLYDTIVIGYEKDAKLCLRASDSAATVKNLRTCEGTPGRLTLEYPLSQVPDTTTFSVFRISNGQRINLPTEECLTIGEEEEGPTSYQRSVTLRSTLPTTGLIPNKIDSIFVQPYYIFTSHCEKSDSMLVSVYPNFNFTDTVGICQGESYRWPANNQSYTTTTQAVANLQSEAHCDSTRRLLLTVYDKSYTIDRIEDCQPLTWILHHFENGVVVYDTIGTFYESNNATATSDTVLLQNRWGCDSTVQLEFTLLPVKAHIQSDREYFDFDHLDAVLTDVSENNDARTWVLPGGTTLSGPVAYYTIPAEYDEADIKLLASATYDEHTCVDSTNIVIPLRKESFWLPNIFTPGSANGNNLFGSTSTRTLKEEMYIYNRNGQLVFFCETPDCKWDGRDLNGTPCPQGTYTYLIRYSNEFLPKVVHVLRGTVTLIR